MTPMLKTYHKFNMEPFQNTLISRWFRACPIFSCLPVLSMPSSQLGMIVSCAISNKALRLI